MPSEQVPHSLTNLCRESTNVLVLSLEHIVGCVWLAHVKCLYIHCTILPSPCDFLCWLPSMVTALCIWEDCIFMTVYERNEPEMFIIEAVPISCCMLHCVVVRSQLSCMWGCKYAVFKIPSSFTIWYGTMRTAILRFHCCVLQVVCLSSDVPFAPCVLHVVLINSVTYSFIISLHIFLKNILMGSPSVWGC